MSFPAAAPAQRAALPLLMIMAKPVYQPSGDCPGAGDLRKRLCSKPPGLGNLFVIDRDFTACILCGETDHQRMGKGPGLASEITYIIDFDCNFFHDLSFYALLEGLTCLHKACQNTEKTPLKTA